MNKKKYRGILLLITITCAIIGTAGHFRYARRSEAVYVETASEDAYGEQQHWETPPFRSLELELSGGTVHIFDGPEGEYSVDFTGPNVLRPSVTVQDGVMRVAYAESEQAIREYGTYDAEYWISLGGYGLESGNLHLEAGTIILENISCPGCAVTCETGTIECMRSRFNDASFTIGDGELLLYDTAGTNISAQIGTGNADISVAEDPKQSVKLITGLGSVTVNEEDAGTSWEKASEDGSGALLTVQTEVGDIVFYQY